MKLCPDCAEEVQGAARVCRHCGYDFKARRNPRMDTGDVAGCAFTGCVIWLLGPILVILVLASIAKLFGF